MEIVICKFGTMKIIPLSEGTFTIDKTKHFVPFDEDEHELHQRPAGSLLVEVQPFVIITSKDILLLDTGLGFDHKDVSAEKAKNLQLHKDLADAGIQPSAITKILLTHLHKDHAGGVSMGKDHSQLSFPQAKYYVQERELDFAFEKGSPSFITDELGVLRNSDRVVLLKNDKGTIDDYIYYEITGAHSPFHQVFWIKENESVIFFGGDEAPQLGQMKHRFIAKYDYDGKKAMELRQKWWEQGKEEKWTYLFYHDVKNPIIKL